MSEYQGGGTFFFPLVQQTFTAPPYMLGGHEVLDMQNRGASSLLSFIHSFIQSLDSYLWSYPCVLGKEEARVAGAGRVSVGSEQGEERALAEPEVRQHLKDRE